MSFPLPDKILQLPDVTIKQLMKKVALKQNGEVSKAMKKMGINYPINYGVVIPQLRALANNYKRDRSLAIQLRVHSNIREALILSSMLDEPEKVDVNDALKICDLISNIELAEQFAQNLFSHIPDILVFVKKIEGTSETCSAISFYSLGWALKLKKEFLPHDMDWIISKIENPEYLKNQLIAKSITFLMQAMADYSAKTSVKVSYLAVKLSKHDNLDIAKIGNDFLWLNTV